MDRLAIEILPRAPGYREKSRRSTGFAVMPGHHDFLRSHIAKRIRVGQDVDDHVQDVYARILASPLTATDVRDWRGLLRRVATTVIIDRFRQDRARHLDAHCGIDGHADAMTDPTADVETLAADRQRLRRIGHALDTLDPVCRQAFVLARIEGWAHKDVATRLGIASVAVGRNVEKAMGMLVRLRLDENRPG